MKTKQEKNKKIEVTNYVLRKSMKDYFKNWNGEYTKDNIVNDPPVGKEEL